MRLSRVRLGLLGVSAGAVLLLIGLRLVSVSLVQRERWLAIGQRQQQRTVRLAPERGSLLDREGRELAVSQRAWSAFIDPSLLSSDEEREAAVAALSPVLGQTESRLRKKLNRPGSFSWLERKLDVERRDELEALDLTGLGFVPESKRVFPGEELAAHVLGAVGTDNDGLEGLEHVLDPIVAGRPGQLLTMKDARGDEFLPGGLSHRPPTRGADVVLTLDTVAQYLAERELARAVAETGATAGTVLVMLPGNGDVAALSNLPTFNPNNFPTYPSHLRTNRAVASCYEPGSTFKIFTVATALQAGLLESEEIIDCGNGALRVGSVRVKDHRPFDRLVVEDVLALSSNIGAIRIGQRLGNHRLHASLTALGFGGKTGVEAPGESAGILRAPRRWTPLSLASISFGHEVAVTPLQLVRAGCAVANGGLLPTPRLVREHRREDGSVKTQPVPRPRRVFTEDTARLVSKMLEATVERGTGRLAQVPGYRVAGKTGTAQKLGSDGRYVHDRHVASFLGWAPADDPAFVALVVIDEPRGPRQHGGEVAAPVFARLARDLLRHWGIPPEPTLLAESERTGGSRVGGGDAG
ncbi:MAG: penicillin-binding transpeptidase domain-containing protein [Acidobacteriota bacterium]